MANDKKLVISNNDASNFLQLCPGLEILKNIKTMEKVRGLVSKETAVLRRWGVERNVWFINRVDN